MKRSTRPWSRRSWPRSRPEPLSRRGSAWRHKRSVRTWARTWGTRQRTGPAGDVTHSPGQRRTRGRIVRSMSDDVLEFADRLWRGEVGPSDYHPVSHLGGLAEICDVVAFVPSFANVSAFATPDGLVLVDTGSSFAAAAVHGELRRRSGQRLHTVVYSHGHIDHVF